MAEKRTAFLFTRVLDAVQCETMSFSNVGKVWTVDTFEKYLTSVEPEVWTKAVCLHHTAAPSLKQRPRGFTIQHIVNIQNFYEEKGWQRGPHFFIDEDQIFGMTPVNEKGIHAVSFNSSAIGIEVLGDYDSESNTSGRGYQCWQTASAATKLLLDWLRLPVNSKTVLFHRDDPKTNKTCPGRKVQKPWVIDLVNKKGDLEAGVPAVITPPYMQLVSVATYLTDIKGYNYEDIRRNLYKSPEGLLMFNDIWIEHATYDADKAESVAPISELYTIPAKK